MKTITIEIDEEAHEILQEIIDCAAITATTPNEAIKSQSDIIQMGVKTIMRYEKYIDGINNALKKGFKREKESINQLNKSNKTIKEAIKIIKSLNKELDDTL